VVLPPNLSLGVYSDMSTNYFQTLDLLRSNVSDETAASRGDRAGLVVRTRVSGDIERGKKRANFMDYANDLTRWKDAQREKSEEGGSTDGIGSDIFGALFGEGESIRKERETFEDLEAEYNKPAEEIKADAENTDEPTQPTVTKSTSTNPTAATGSERLMLARTLQAEAGNQGYEGMLDVGSVIMNRANNKKNRFGKGLAGVILKPGQFSAWNSRTGYAGGAQGQNMNFTPNKTALKAADAILSGDYKDRTGGATHYYAIIPKVSGVPRWSNNTFKRIDGAHYFGKA